MSNYFLIIFLIISSFFSIYITIKMDTQSLITLTVPSEIIIQGTYNGGCGFAYMKKKKSLDELKLYLTNSFKIPSENIKILMLNYKPADNNKKDVPIYIDKKPFNKSEFNLFVISGNVRELVGTSDQSNELHYSYLQFGLPAEKDKFHKSISERILNFYINTYQ
jgi:hypothetical protein